MPKVKKYVHVYVGPCPIAHTNKVYSPSLIFISLSRPLKGLLKFLWSQSVSYMIFKLFILLYLNWDDMFKRDQNNFRNFLYLKLVIYILVNHHQWESAAITQLHSLADLIVKFLGKKIKDITHLHLTLCHGYSGGWNMSLYTT